MRTVDFLRISLVLGWLICPTANSLAKDRLRVSASEESRQSAIQFLSSLDEKRRADCTFDFDGPERTDWHFIPKERVGVSFQEMTLQQRRAAHQLMRAVLSDKGYLKSIAIMSLEQVLRVLEADRENVNEIRNPEKYWFALFGDPQSGKPWGWRVEGHHLSLNFTSIDGLVVGTAPIFFGSNPAEVRVGPQQGLRVLGNEEDQARELMVALSTTLQQQAMIAETAPREVLTVPGQPIDLGEPAGVAASAMTKVQQEMLQELVLSFLHHLRPELANREIRALETAGREKVHFAWAGSLNPEEKHYFRLHGPTFLLEYDNSQGNHAHLVWHSMDNDFAADALQRHYQESPHHQGEK